MFAGKYKLSLLEALFSSSLGSALASRAIAGLHEFGRYVNDLEFRARHTHGAEDSRAFMLEWLKDIAYEKHLYDGEEHYRWWVMWYQLWLAERAVRA